LIGYNRDQQQDESGEILTLRTDELYEEALILLEKWDLKKAEDILLNIVDISPQHAKAWNKLGVVFARKNDLRQAEDCFNQAIEMDSTFASPYSNLGNIYAERGWSERARKAYEQALILDPGNPAATHNLGILYRKSGDIGKGIDLMKQAHRTERSRFGHKRSTKSEYSKVSKVRWIIMAIVALLVFYFLNR